MSDQKMAGNKSSFSQIKFIYIVTTLFLVGLSLYSYIQFTRFFKASRLVYHTHEVISTLEAISSALEEAELNTHGYSTTGDTSLLQRKDKAIQTISDHRKVLDSLIKDDQKLMQDAAIFNTAVDEKIQSIQDYSDSGSIPSDPVIRQIEIDEEMRKMKEVNVWLDALTNEEASLMHGRTQLFSNLTVMAPIHIIVLFLGALLILFYSYYSVYTALTKSHDLHATLVRQSISKEALAAELMETNKVLAFQNEEKEKRASELVIANQELGFQNREKEKRASELVIANQELEFQNIEKEKRAAELVLANKELQLFLNISSHDLQEPLRKIQMAASRIAKEDIMAMSEKGRSHFEKMQEGALSMQTLLQDLMTYERTNTEERKFELVNVQSVIHEVLMDLKEVMEEKEAMVDIKASGKLSVVPFQFRQMLYNIISNALKFSIPGQPPQISISSVVKLGSDLKNAKLKQDQEYCHIQIADNGIGFDPKYKEQIFEVFQRLTGKDTYKGTGIGLAIVKRIVENHNGVVSATSQLNEGARFDIYLPTLKSLLYE